ncbi:hypothetical protein [Maribacter sp. 4G9]|uniref:hypothetical protein n=1 Tax=Maribacter sp. 4G9 TaxID=1889777 RepID=UPI000C1589FD|nr:hypothetical protein [Maribacter sp. 4G9]PIB26250.1 hypothetical protein BFP75_08400 [Maribacter sp. 4G9]
MDTKKEYHFPSEIPNKNPSNTYLDVVDQSIKSVYFRTALANLYETMEKRWNGEKGLDNEINRLKEVCKKRIGWIIDLDNLPKIKPSLSD